MTKSLCIQINDVANQMLPAMSPAQMNNARADLRRIADLVKEMEMFCLEHQAKREGEVTEQHASVMHRVVVQFPKRFVREIAIGSRQ